MRITRVMTLPDGIETLAGAARAEGFRFLDRLLAEWESGNNRFDQAGEALFAAFDGDRTIGICGVNRDPHESSGEVARLRHLYVLPASRRAGVGRGLVGASVGFAREAGYRAIRLRTDSDAAARVYEAWGFEVDASEQATHKFLLR